jgi:hypothetical protein
MPAIPATAKAATPPLRHGRRAIYLWLGIAVAVIVGSLAMLRQLALGWAGDIAYDSCIENVSASTPAKCRCLANRLSRRMVSYDYIQGRLVRDEGLQREEVNDMKRSCGL